MSTDEQELRWKINNVRESISLDWANLAMKNPSADRRKVIREHLDICYSTLKDLKDLVERNRSASQKSKLENHQLLRRMKPDDDSGSRC
jgi:hypothetical protein